VVLQRFGDVVLELGFEDQAVAYEFAEGDAVLFDEVEVGGEALAVGLVGAGACTAVVLVDDGGLGRSIAGLLLYVEHPSVGCVLSAEGLIGLQALIPALHRHLNQSDESALSRALLVLLVVVNVLFLALSALLLLG
jgi:hypothetical protein